MRIYFWGTFIGLTVLLASGKAGTVIDYGTIAWNYVTKSVESSIPIGVELERFKLSIGQLDQQIAQSGRTVAEESVAIDRYAAEVDSKVSGLAAIKSELGGLKAKYVCTDSDEAKESIKASMAKRVARFQSQSEAVKSMQDALERRRDSFNKMVQSFDEQKMTREVLQGKFESLKADYTSMQMRGQLGSTELDAAGVRKATELAISIADRLEVERRLSNQVSEGLVEIRSVEPSTLEMATVDAILGDQTSFAAR